MKCKGCSHEEEKGFIFKDKFYCDDCCKDLFDELCRNDLLKIEQQITEHYYYGDGDYMGSDDDLSDVDVLENVSLNFSDLKRIGEVQNDI